MASHPRSMDLPPFQPPWWLRGGHQQTLAAGCWFGHLPQYSATPHEITLSDGDTVVVHDDRPLNWRPGGNVALLMHGLSGSHQSPLLVRLTEKLTQRGIRVFRWDLRGAGAGQGLARRPYHAGCSEDLAHVINRVMDWCRPAAISDGEPDPQPPATSARLRPFLHLLGVSLSGNILLKYLGERPDQVPPEVSQAIAVNPPINLSQSVKAMGRSLLGWYDRHFVEKLFREVEQRRRILPDAPMPPRWDRPQGMMEFDDWYTAPMSGFESCGDYYQRCSAEQFMPDITTPTTVITSRDDPMVPFPMMLASVDQWSSHVRLATVAGGGHVGYFARRGIDPDEFWLDWRIVELMTGHHS